MNESFDGEFSESDSEASEQDKTISVPICSKRVATKRAFNKEQIARKNEEVKILCHGSVEEIFINVYNDLRLQSDIDKWYSKLNMESLNQLSQQKK